MRYTERQRKVTKLNYAYIVRCADGTLYTGWTNNLQRRLAAHNAGKGAKYTRARRPVELFYWETFDTCQEAMRREAALKRLRRAEKLALGGNKERLCLENTPHCERFGDLVW